MLFGLVAVVAGVSQVRSGKINKSMVVVVLLLGGALFVFAQLSLIFL